MGTAHTLGQALVGQAFAGAGAGIGELTGLAGLAETGMFSMMCNQGTLLTHFSAGEVSRLFDRGLDRICTAILRTYISLECLSAPTEY